MNQFEFFEDLYKRYTTIRKFTEGDKITFGDFLAGGGGVTEAASRLKKVEVKWVLNHSPIAIQTNIFNHTGVEHFLSDFFTQDEHEMTPVDIMWASIECTQHSRANGGRSKKVGSYTMAWELARYIVYLRPYVIGIENVPEFKRWSPTFPDGTVDKSREGEVFESWKKSICALGYDYHESINNAADFGIPTRRVRYFAFFTKTELHMEVRWPKKTHDKYGRDGLKKWVACKHYINLADEGESIFGRSLNNGIRRCKRSPLVPNTQKRIGGGIKKLHPEMAQFFQMIFQYYGTGDNVQTLDAPINTITTKDRHVLVTIEKMQFITNYFSSGGKPETQNHSIEKPLNAITTGTNKQGLVTVNKMQFIQDHCYGDHYHSVEEPIAPQLTWETKSLITVDKKQFLSPQNNCSGKPEKSVNDIDSPLHTITTKEKFQFITTHLNLNPSKLPGSRTQSIESPIGTITASDNKALITVEELLQDFDIKMRFLTAEELSRLSTFPPQYFTHPKLKITKKEQTRLIGNAVPPDWAELHISPVVDELYEKLLQYGKS